MWFLVWLLCALDSTPLWRIDVLFLLVGHTHNKLDRLFSRIAVALAGRDYFTVVGMLRQLQPSLSHCTVKSNHLSQVWAWKGLMEHPCTRGMRNLDPVDAFRAVSTRNGSSGLRMRLGASQYCLCQQSRCLP